MTRLRKQVDGLQGADCVVGGEVGEVSGEGGWVAADVEDVGDVGGDEGVEEFVVAAFAGWVDDGEIGVVAFGEPFWQPLLGFGGVEVGICEDIGASGLLGVVDGLADAVDADEALARRGDEAADGADATIEVKDGGVGREVGQQIFAALVEDLSLNGVDLEKGRWRKLVVARAEAFANGGFASEEGVGAAEHEARVGVDVVPDAHDLRPFRLEAVDKGLLAKFLRTRDKNDHHFAIGVAFADHDLGNAAAGAGGGDGVLEPGGEGVDLGAKEQAVGGRHELVAALFKKAEARPAAGVIGVKNALVAIAPGFVHAANLAHVDVELGNARHGVAHLGGFELGLEGSVGNLQSATAAASCLSAGRRDALGAWRKHGVEARLGDALLALAGGDEDGFAGKRAGYKNDLSVDAANAGAVMGKASDFTLNLHDDSSAIESQRNTQ